MQHSQWTNWVLRKCYETERNTAILRFALILFKLALTLKQFKKNKCFWGKWPQSHLLQRPEHKCSNSTAEAKSCQLSIRVEVLKAASGWLSTLAGAQVVGFLAELVHALLKRRIQSCQSAWLLDNLILQGPEGLGFTCNRGRNVTAVDENVCLSSPALCVKILC